MPVMSVFTRFQQKTVKLPIVDIKFFHTIKEKLKHIFCVSVIGNAHIAALPVIAALAGALHSSAELVGFQIIAAARSEPKSEFGRKFLAERRALIEFIGKFIIEAPKILIVINPTVVYDIRIERRNARTRKSLFYFKKRVAYVFACYIKHMVVPRIVLCAEINRFCNAFYILKEIGSHDLHIKAARRTADCRM